MIGRMFRWLGQNWEPITALLALAMSALSTYVGIRGINLANAGVELAQQAQAEERRYQTISRLPVLQFNVDYTTGTISLSNNGLGPGVLIAYGVSYDGQTQVFRYDDDIDSSLDRLRSIVQAAFKNIPKVQTSLPFGVWKADESRAVFSVASDASRSGQLHDALSGLQLAACFMDVTGEFKVVAGYWPKNRPELCTNAPPSLTDLLSLSRQNSGASGLVK